MTWIITPEVSRKQSIASHLGSLPEEAVHTAQFVEKMDRLFNCFNSSHFTSSKKMKYAMSEKSDHKAFLKDMLSWLETVKSNSTHKLPCLSGWKLAVNCLLQLWDYLHDQLDVAYLFTDRLNQDCVENLFSVIRRKGGQMDNPDSTLFRAALRQTMVDTILLSSSNSNCKEDVDSFLFNLSSTHNQGIHAFNNNVHVYDDTIPESVQSIMSVFMPQELMCIEEENILVHTAGYVARKLSGKVCESCGNMLKGSINKLDQSHVLLMNKNYGDSKGKGLITPSTALIQVLTVAEKEYRSIFERCIHLDGIRCRLIRCIMNKVGSDLNCSEGLCQTLRSVICLFVNIRLHHNLKENNREFANAKGRKNRKLLKFKHI
jgi:hypothetical protein